jgi:hypothetical protein
VWKAGWSVGLCGGEVGACEEVEIGFARVVEFEPGGVMLGDLFGGGICGGG